MIARFHYDEQTLESLLGNRLGKSEDEVVAHVESCDECQDRLEDMMAGGLSWEDVGEVLRERGEGCPADGSERNADAASITSFLEPTDHPGSLGRFARFEIMEILGRGGMGIVMRGYDTSLHRHSAVKVLAPEFASSAAARRRFSREAKSAAAVVHPHVVPIQTVDEHNGLPFLVMPVVEGRSLQQRVDQDGPLDIIAVIRIASQVAEGLAAAHAQGLVHRDIKPANVLLENGVERVQITDFGLARAIDDASMTRSGVIAGTPQYMSPEQAHGDSIDHRSDLFSLGSLMYFMLTGRSPFRAATTMGVLNRIVNDAPRPIREINSDVPEWLENEVMRLLSKSADDRYQTANEVIDALRHGPRQPLAPRPDKSRNRSGWTRHPSKRGLMTLFRKPPHWLVATGFGGLLALLGTIIVLETNKGTITIDCDVENVPIRILQGKEVIDRLTVTKSSKSVRIAAGNYVVEADGDGLGVVINNGSVSLERRGAETVTIRKRADDAAILLSSDFRPGRLAGLRFGERQDPVSWGDGSAYGRPNVAEPGTTSELFATFPTLGNGIEDVALIVQLQTNKSESPNLLVSRSGIQRIFETHPSTAASQDDAEFFASGDDPYRVGYQKLLVDSETKSSFTFAAEPGIAHIRIVNVVGRPGKQVRDALGLPVPSGPTQFWLPASLELFNQSEWAGRLMNLDGWQKDPTTVYHHVLQQTVQLLANETKQVSIKPPSASDSGDGTEREHVADETGIENNPSPPIDPEMTAGQLDELIRSKGRELLGGRMELAIEFKTLWPTKDGQREIITSLGTASWLQKAGMIRIEIDRMVPEEKSVKLRAEQWTTGMDGNRFYSWNRTDNSISYGKLRRGAIAYAPSLLFWGRSVPSHAHSMFGPNPKIQLVSRDGREELDVVVEDATNNVSLTYVGINPRRGYLPTRVESRVGRRLQSLIEFQDFFEPRPGVWAAKTIDWTLWSDEDDVDGKPIVNSRTKFTVTRLELGDDANLDDEDFQVAIPEQARNEDSAVYDSPGNGDVVINAKPVPVETLLWNVAGAVFTPVLEDELASAKWKGGLRVTHLRENGPAQDALLRLGSIIVAMDAKPIESIEAIELKWRRTDYGAPVFVTSLRAGQEVVTRMKWDVRVLDNNELAQGEIRSRANDRVVVSIGTDDGVYPGDRLETAGLPLGILEVVTVAADHSTARIVGEHENAPLKKGDIVVYGRMRLSTPPTSKTGNAKEVEAEKVSKAHDHADPQSFEAILANYNRDTRQERSELFDPPIPDMTLEQLRQGFFEGAKTYRSAGKNEIANLLERFAEKGRLDDGVVFYVGGSNYAPVGKPGKRYRFKQFAPSMNVDIPSNVSKTNVVLSSIELRYSSNGYRSKTYGDIHPPLDGTWQLVEVQRGAEELLDDALASWLNESPSFSRLIIRDDKLVMPKQGKKEMLAGEPTPEDSVTYDLKLDYSTMVPRFVATRGGVIAIDGIFSSDGFIEDSELNLLLPLDDAPPPRTFKEKGEKTLYLKYKRQSNLE